MMRTTTQKKPMKICMNPIRLEKDLLLKDIKLALIRPSNLMIDP